MNRDSLRIGRGYDPAGINPDQRDSNKDTLIPGLLLNGGVQLDFVQQFSWNTCHQSVCRNVS